MMNLTDIAAIRLASQQIAETKFKGAKELVGWMGAMQAQDYAMVKWAMGVRLPGATEQDIEAALSNGEIIRIHLLRPTWHVVSSEDIHWLLDLTAPRLKASLKTRHRQLELSEAILNKSNAIFEEALSGGKHLTREELTAELKKANIATDNNRLSHLLYWAELEGLLCSGGTKEGKTTHALLQERVPKTKSLTREEALATLAQRYFTSHGPATLQDFVWWSGLSVGEARQGLEMVKAAFSSETVDSQTYWLTPSTAISKRDEESAFLLPAFDEFIISYKDRRASLPLENHKKSVSDNGIFWPIIVVNGQVMGNWKRTVKKDKVLVETKFFQQPDTITRGRVEKAAMPFSNFLGKTLEISHSLL
jgi:hypothetical protein